MRFVVLGNPANRRLTGFAEAAQAAGHRVALLSWRDLLAGELDLAAQTEGAVVKLDSPGEDWEVERSLLARGAEVPDAEHPDAARIPARDARTLEHDRGRIVAPRQWYRGFVATLADVTAALSEGRPRLVANDPGAIGCMFDKPRCHAALDAAGVAVAPALPRVRSYDELREAMRDHNAPRVFVKLSWGSSASGVLALEARAGRVQARTSVELVAGDPPRLYNSLRLRRYTDEAQVAAIVDALAREGVHVERWLPKAGHAGRAFDLRIHVLAGRARHAVVRSSRSPLTNLHLGNQRGDLGAVRERLGPDRWRAVELLAEQADACFAGHYSGVDLLLGIDWSNPTIVEVNAFGDLLPRLEHDGEGCYAAQVHAFARLASPPA